MPAKRFAEELVGVAGELVQRGENALQRPTLGRQRGS